MSCVKLTHYIVTILRHRVSKQFKINNFLDHKLQSILFQQNLFRYHSSKRIYSRDQESVAFILKRYIMNHYLFKRYISIQYCDIKLESSCKASKIKFSWQSMISYGTTAWCKLREIICTNRTIFS